MKLPTLFLAPLLAAGAAAVVAAAPIAAAAPDCTYAGRGDSVCQSPGNAQIVAAPPRVDYQPWGPYPYGGNLIVLGGHPHHGR